MKARLIGLLNDEAGQGMAEYGLIIALVSILIIGTLTAFRGSLLGFFDRIIAAL